MDFLFSQSHKTDTYKFFHRCRTKCLQVNWHLLLRDEWWQEKADRAQFPSLPLRCCLPPYQGRARGKLIMSWSVGPDHCHTYRHQSGGQSSVVGRKSCFESRQFRHHFHGRGGREAHGWEYLKELYRLWRGEEERNARAFARYVSIF